jgi:integrase
MRQQSNSETDPRLLVPVAKSPGIYRRGNRYVVRYRDQAGRQHKRFAKTLAEAKNLQKTLTADVIRGEHREVSRVTFVGHAPEWIRHYQGRTSRGFREGTREGYARELGVDPKTFEPVDPPAGAIRFFGRMRLSEITAPDVKAYVRELDARGAAPSTIRNAIAPVKAMLGDAHEDGLIRSNPARGVRVAVSSSNGDGNVDLGEEVKTLDAKELRALLDAVRPDRKVLVMVLAAAGLRVSELLPLRWGDLDFGRRRLRVRRSYSRGRIGPPKTRHGRREVPLAPGITTALWNLRKAATHLDDDALIFPNQDGGFLNRGHVYRAVKAAAKKAGVPWAGPKTLRHTAATLLFRDGWNPKQVQKFMGHHSAAFTLATYVHLLADDMPQPTFLDAPATRGILEATAAVPEPHIRGA